MALSTKIYNKVTFFSWQDVQPLAVAKHNLTTAQAALDAAIAASAPDDQIATLTNARNNMEAEVVSIYNANPDISYQVSAYESQAAYLAGKQPLYVVDRTAKVITGNPEADLKRVEIYNQLAVLFYETEKSLLPESAEAKDV